MGAFDDDTGRESLGLLIDVNDPKHHTQPLRASSPTKPFAHAPRVAARGVNLVVETERTRSSNGEDQDYDDLLEMVLRRPSKRLSQMMRTSSNGSDFGIRSSSAGLRSVMTDITDMLERPATQAGRRSGIESPSWIAIVSGICLCANTVVGAGTLAVPFTMRLTGFVLYHAIILAVFIANFVSCRWLSILAHELPNGVPRSYEGIAHHYLGGEADFAFSIALILGGFALTMAYMLFITSSLASAASGALLQWLPQGSVEHTILFSVGLGIVLPLLFLRDLSSLRYTASFAVCTLLCTAAYVVVSGTLYVQDNGVHEGFTPMSICSGTVDAIPMVVSAYSCQLLVIPIYDSLGKGQTPALMNKVMAAALGLAAVIYEVVGFAGYMQFGSTVKDNILASIAEDHPGSLMTSVVNVSMALTLICHVPILVWPLRTCVISAWRYLVIGFEEEQDEPTDCQWRAASCFIMLGVLALATLMPCVKTALSIVGSVGGAFIVFIYPAAFHLVAVRKVPLGSKWLATEHTAELLMITIGILVGIVCFTMSILNSFRSGQQVD